MKIISQGASFSERNKKRIFKWLLITLGITAGSIFLLIILYKRIPDFAYFVILVVVIGYAIPSFIKVFQLGLKNYQKMKLGAMGEERVREMLKQTLDDNYLYISNLSIPNTRIGDIDALLVGPKGLFILEIKTWHGRFKVLGPNICLDRGRGNLRMYKNVFKQVLRQADFLERYLKEKNLNIRPRPIIVFVLGKITEISGSPGVWITDATRLTNDIFKMPTKPEFTTEFCGRLLNTLK